VSGPSQAKAWAAVEYWFAAVSVAWWVLLRQLFGVGALARSATAEETGPIVAYGDISARDAFALMQALRPVPQSPEVRRRASALIQSYR
jgi:hypothetical protein